jgi:superfamily I DNA/RNA helicase
LIACAGLHGQVNAAARFIKQAAEELRMPVWAGAVLVRGNKAGEEFANALTATGLPAALVKGDTFDLDQRVVKVMTLHSAKGLEFPFSILARVDSDQIPLLWGITDHDEKEARLADERRLLSVGLSRAMRRMALLYSESRPSQFIQELAPALWERVG